MKIEVRAWHEINKEMIYPNNKSFLSIGDIIRMYDDDNIMLKSSFTDLEHKSIYEGDIIERHCTAPWDDQVPVIIRQVVLFGFPYPDCFCLKSIGNDDNTSLLCDIAEDFVIPGKIIGNNREHSNLLK